MEEIKQRFTVCCLGIIPYPENALFVTKGSCPPFRNAGFHAGRDFLIASRLLWFMPLSLSDCPGGINLLQLSTPRLLAVLGADDFLDSQEIKYVYRSGSHSSD